jgi:hypothetical protein
MTDEIRSAADVEGNTDREQEYYNGMMEDLEARQGQLSQPVRARLAIESMIDGVFTIDDVCELSGVARSTVEEVVERELYLENIQHEEDLATGGKYKSGFVLVE